MLSLSWMSKTEENPQDSRKLMYLLAKRRRRKDARTSVSLDPLVDVNDAQTLGSDEVSDSQEAHTRTVESQTEEQAEGVAGGFLVFMSSVTCEGASTQVSRAHLATAGVSTSPVPHPPTTRSTGTGSSDRSSVFQGYDSVQGTSDISSTTEDEATALAQGQTCSRLWRHQESVFLAVRSIASQTVLRTSTRSTQTPRDYGDTSSATESKDPKFRCSWCNINFSCGTYLKLHYKAQHRRGGKHGCRFCNYSSDKMCNLRRHESSHVGEKRYTCHVCSKGFVEKRNLSNHTAAMHVTHKCSTCGQEFRGKSHLRKHLGECVKESS